MRYVAITYRGRYFYVQRGDQNRGLVTLQGTGVGPDTIFERMELGDDRVAFRTWDGLHLTAESTAYPGPGILWARPYQGSSEQIFFEVWLPDDRVGLRTHLQTFVCAEGNGKGDLVINRRQLGEWEKFYYEQPPQELIPQEEEAARPQVTTTVKEARTTLDGPAFLGTRDRAFRRLGG